MKSLAVAYQMKKRNKKAAPEVKSEETGDEAMDIDMMKHKEESDPKVMEGAGLEEGNGAEGSQPADSLHGSLNEDIVDAIMAKRQKLAKGGMVEEAGDSSTVFAPEDAFNQHGQESNLKENYASDLSNETDDQSVIGQILSERRKKRMK